LDGDIQPMALFVAPPAGSAESPLERTLANNALSGNIGVDFKTTDKILVYINLARGFKGAGFNVSFAPEANVAELPFQFKPEYINSYELGLKLKTSNRYLFNAAVFVTDFRDKQEVVSVGSTTLVDNAKAVQGQGAEVEFTGIWTSFFKTDIAVGALNMKYVDFVFDNPTTPEIENLSGNQAFKAAPLTFKFAPEIHTPLGKKLKLLIRGDYNFVGKTYNDIFNTEGLARQATGQVNMRVGVSTKNERFSIALWGKNLTDETYIQHGWSYIFADQVAINPPRLIGMELRVNFY
jgi:iron complex outermembrane receptor protein